MVDFIGRLCGISDARSRSLVSVDEFCDDVDRKHATCRLKALGLGRPRPTDLSLAAPSSAAPTAKGLTVATKAHTKRDRSAAKPFDP